LETIADRVRDQDRAAALKARLEMTRAASGADIATLKSRLERDANDHEARLMLANALALRQDYAGPRWSICWKSSAVIANGTTRPAAKAC
jgi:thioredoxin-like negative regulator of GroEL